VLFSEANSVILDGMEDLGLLPHGAHLYRKPNGAGGHTYYTDECGIMSFVWDTCLVHRSTLAAAMLVEEHTVYLKQVSDRKQQQKITRELEIDRAAATGGSFLNPVPTKKVE